MDVSHLGSGASSAALREFRLPDRSIADLITRLVVARAAIVRSTDPELADRFLTLAHVGHTNPAVYAAVLGCTDEAIRLSGFEGQTGNWFRAA
jgi:hypothetical protein